MNILFIHPEKFLNIGIPSGIATLGAILKLRGHNVRVFDTTLMKPVMDQSAHVLSAGGADDNISAGDEVAGTSRRRDGLYKQTSVTLDDLIADDPEVIYEDELQKAINAFQPDLIGISAMTTTFDFACDLLRSVKHDAKVIVGGVHATIAPQDCIEQDVIDIVCIGEADNVMAELCDLMQAGKDYTKVKSMWFKLPDGQVKKNPIASRVSDLNILPTPDWSLFDDRQLFRPFDGTVYKGSFYSQSRGCPMRCTYCVDPTIAEVTGGRKGYFRYQSPETSYKQLSELKDSHGATWFKFVDDTFLMPPIEHLERLRDLIKPLGIQFGCSVMPNTIKPEKVALARDMGCVAMSIGVESGDPDIRETVMRRYKNEELIERLKIVKDHGIRISTFNMIGFPGESRDQVFRTIELNRQLRSDACNVYIVYPYPGSPIAIKKGAPLRNSKGQIPEADTASTLGLSKMEETELEGLRETFNAYLHLPKSLWPIIKLAESQTPSGKEALKVVNAYTIDLLSGNRVETVMLKDIASDSLERTGIDGGTKVPVAFSELYDLDFPMDSVDGITSSLYQFATGSG